MNKNVTYIVIIFLSGLMIAQGAYVITARDQRVDGIDIRARSNGEIILKTTQGTRTFLKGQYKRAVADKPVEIDKARKLSSAGKYTEASEILEKIVREYAFLEWDNKARELLTTLYGKIGDHSAVLNTFEDLFASSPESANDSKLQWNYRNALLAAGKNDKLALILDEVIASGDRADAAKAQVMRGDLKLARNELEPAVLDYLRTVILFKQQQDSVAEAAFKAGTTLEQLRDSRSKKMFKMVVEEYPTSPYAEQAQAKL